MTDIQPEIGDIYYSDYVGWHVVLIQQEVTKYKDWWLVFILEEEQYNWFIAEDFNRPDSMWDKLT